MECPRWLYHHFRDEAPNVRVLPGTMFAYRSGWGADPERDGKDTQGYRILDSKGEYLRYVRDDEEPLQFVGSCLPKPCRFTRPLMLRRRFPNNSIDVYRDRLTNQIIFAVDLTAGDGGILWFDSKGSQLHRTPQYGWEKPSPITIRDDANFRKRITRLC
jgi:hypothetical protein